MDQIELAAKTKYTAVTLDTSLANLSKSIEATPNVTDPKETRIATAEK